jgi:hypothetical protein
MATTTTTPRRANLPRSTRWAAGVVMGAVLAGGLPASAQAQAQSTTTVAQARGALGAARATRQQAEQRRASLHPARTRLGAKLAASSAEVNAIAEQLAAARQSVRDRAVEAFVSGGDMAQIEALFGTDHVEDASARSAILLNQADSAKDAADVFLRMKQENDPAVVALAASFDDLARRIDEARSDVLQASALEADAERALGAARMSASAAAPRSTVATGRPVAHPTARPAARATAPRRAVTSGGDGWAALVRCESGGDYSAVSSSGRYRGAYQFDQSTWESVGGTGDPAAAAPAEQDARARMLFEQRGARAWPHCGRLLAS